MLQTYFMPTDLQTLLDDIHADFPGIDIQAENRLRFYEYHFENLESGMKTCTIRFSKTGIRIPWGIEENTMLPCFATRPDDKDYLKEMGIAWIPKIMVGHVRDFPLWAAVEDGFKSLQDMKRGIGAIYGVTLGQGDTLSYYKLQQYSAKDSL